MIEGYRDACPLCRLTQDGEVLTRLRYEDAQIVVVDCLVCRVPMAVAKAHRANFVENEKSFVRDHFKKMLHIPSLIPEDDETRHFLTPDEQRLIYLLPDWYYHGPIQWVIDWEQRQIPDHPHCHLRPFPFPNTNQWEEVGMQVESRK